MNELIFFLHICLLGLLLFFSAKKGAPYLYLFSAFCAVCANLFVLKQIDLFFLQVTPSDPFAIFCGLAICMAQELHGPKVARSIITSNFCALGFVALVSLVHLSYLPSGFDSTQSHYLAIFGVGPRILAASMVTFYLAQRADTLLFGFLRKTICKNNLPLALGLSSSICHTFDTLLFSFLGLFGLVSNLWHVIFFGLCIKLITTFFSSSVVALFARRLHADPA